MSTERQSFATIEALLTASLGTELFTSPCIAPVVRARRAAVGARVASLVKDVLGSRGACDRLKAVVCSAYVSTKVLFDAGTWGLLTKADACAVHVSVMSELLWSVFVRS